MLKRKEMALRFPGGKAKTLTLSYDDGVIQDIRLVEMLRKSGIKCTFNINSGCFAAEDAVPNGKNRRMSAKQCLQTFTDDVCEVAIHSYNHPTLTLLDSATICCEIVDDRRALEALFNRQIHGMAYPNGPFNDTVVEVARLCGIYYARTVVSTEKFSIPATRDQWLRLPATCKHTNPRLMELCDDFLSLVPKLEPRMFYLWGHSYEFDDDNNWHVIEQFIDKMKGRDDIWYATNMEIYQAWEDFHRLETSADGSRVYNPNIRSVWFANYRGEIYEIKPGQTIQI